MALGSTRPLTEMSTARLKRDGTRAETRFGLSAKRTSPFKLAGGSVQSTTGSRGVRISGSNGSEAECKTTGYPLPLPLLCVTVCQQFSTELYQEHFLGVKAADA